MTPHDVSYASSKKVWWLCGEGHEWSTRVAARGYNGSGCPYCSGFYVSDVNRLSIHYPDVSEQWHPERNGTLIPQDVHYGSNKKRWWRCGEGHEWQAVVADRTLQGTGCPFCAGQRVIDSNRLSILYSEVAKQWHSMKNGQLTPDDVAKASNKKVWWICEKYPDHEWEAVIVDRTIGRQGCPFCAGKRVSDTNKLSGLYPNVAKQWHPDSNGDLTPEDVTYGSNKKVWWICQKYPGHEWEATPAERTTRGSGCPFCSGKRVADSNRLSTHYPQLVSEWHPDKNGELTPDDVVEASNKRAWWICQERHEWEAVIASRTHGGNGCPYCAGVYVSDSNRLSLHYSDVARHWHPEKNGGLAPDDVSYGSNEKVWWLCEKYPDHEWEATPAERTTRGRGCPFCSSQRVADSNRLSVNFPEVAKQWHPTRNGELTPDSVAEKSNRKVWWVCENGHEWKAVISSRTRGGNGCRECTIPHRSKVEIQLACELASFFSDIVPERTHKIPTLGGKALDVDILIPSQRLVLEYDGAHWHTVRWEEDQAKTEMLEDAGWNVLRIRERPLKLVRDTDLQVPVSYPNDVKRLTDKVLVHLQKSFGIYITGLDEYLARDSLVNEPLAKKVIGEESSSRQ